jgi:hypothetical protein
MQRTSLPLLATSAALLLAALVLGPGSTPAQALPEPASIAGPRLALLSTGPEATHSTLLFARAHAAEQPLGQPVEQRVEQPVEQPVEVLQFEHRPGAVVRGAVLPGTEIVLAIADVAPDREPSWAASLFRLAPGEPPRELIDGVCHASRPLVTPSGRVFVERGSKGAEPQAGGQALRVDALTIEEIEPASGAARTIYGGEGYMAHLAGWIGTELFVYRVGPAGADLAAVTPETGAVRVVVPSWPAAARDFSVDAARGWLVAQQADGTWNHPTRGVHVERIDAATGARVVLARSGGSDMAPLALPSGATLAAPDGARGAALAGAGAGVAPRLPSGDGFLWATALSADGAYLAGLWWPPREQARPQPPSPGAAADGPAAAAAAPSLPVLPRALAVRLSDGLALEATGRAGERLDVAGVLGGAR